MAKLTTAGFDNASATIRTIRYLLTAMRRARTAFTIRRRRKHAVRHLHSLDDNMLRDIGIDRSEITSIVYGRGHQRRRFERD